MPPDLRICPEADSCKRNYLGTTLPVGARTGSAVLELLGRPRWQLQAACRDADPALFFTTRGFRVPEEARALCARCVVSAECLQFAVAGGASLLGTWAATSPRERRRLRLARGGSPALP